LVADIRIWFLFASSVRQRLSIVQSLLIARAGRDAALI